MDYVNYIIIGILIWYIFYRKDKDEKRIIDKIKSEFTNSPSHIMLTRLYIKLKLDEILKDYPQYKKVQKKLKEEDIFNKGMEIAIIDNEGNDYILMFTSGEVPSNWIRKEIYDDGKFMTSSMLRIVIATDIHLAYGVSDNETIFDFPLRLIYNYIYRVTQDSVKHNKFIHKGEIIELQEYLDDVINDYGFKFNPGMDKKYVHELKNAYDAKWSDFEGPPQWSSIHRAGFSFSSKYADISLGMQYSGDERGMSWVSDPNYGNKGWLGVTSGSEEEIKQWTKIEKKEGEAFQKVRDLKSPISE